MLLEFLNTNQTEILALTEQKTKELAGSNPTSTLLRQGLPIFFDQLKEILRLEEDEPLTVPKDSKEMTKAAEENDEEKMAVASGRPNEAELAKTAAQHGAELMRLGYTLSYAVHAYGSMCQSITELASKKHSIISAKEFHDLNRCLDVAIAGAVTEFQSQKDTEVQDKEAEHLGFLAHELRNTLMAINFSVKMIKQGTVGFSGNTGRILDTSLERMQTLIDQSLTEVRLRVDLKPHPEQVNVKQLVNQILTTEEIEAKHRNIKIKTVINSDQVVEVDHQFLYSALSNLIQNAFKYTHQGGEVEIRSSIIEGDILIEVEDECGGLKNETVDLFKPFEKHNKNKSGLGLGLTIAQRAILLNNGKIEVQNLPKKGCIFKITLPVKTIPPPLH
jgi:signal transduction histidine kinase